MGFSAKVKHEALKRSAFRCCACQDHAADVHHIKPKSEGGGNSINNAAPLCASCHDIYGGNPEKRKKIEQMRDHWWQQMAAREEHLIKGNLDEAAYIEIDPKAKEYLKGGGIVLYHAILEHEDFNDAVKALYALLKTTQEQHPNKERYLFVDIDGHRNEQGGFDHDMWELQRHFMLPVLLKYFTQVSMPLFTVRNRNLQDNDIPEPLDIISRDDLRKYNSEVR